MKTFTTKHYNITYTVGQKGMMYSRFKKNKTGEPVVITGFSPTGKITYVKTESNDVYSVITDSGNLKGSHMGNSYVIF